MATNPADHSHHGIEPACPPHRTGGNRRLLSALPLVEAGQVVQALVPAALSLGLFAWLLSLPPTAAGRVYAAYGGVYIGVAILWLWAVDKVTPSTSDWVGVAVSCLGAAIIMFGQREA